MGGWVEERREGGRREERGRVNSEGREAGRENGRQKRRRSATRRNLSSIQRVRPNTNQRKNAPEVLDIAFL